MVSLLCFHVSKLELREQILHLLSLCIQHPLFIYSLIYTSVLLIYWTSAVKAINDTHISKYDKHIYFFLIETQKYFSLFSIASPHQSFLFYWLSWHYSISLALSSQYFLSAISCTKMLNVDFPRVFSLISFLFILHLPFLSGWSIPWIYLLYANNHKSTFQTHLYFSSSTNIYPRFWPLSAIQHLWSQHKINSLSLFLRNNFPVYLVLEVSTRIYHCLWHGHSYCFYLTLHLCYSLFHQSLIFILWLYT